MPLPYALGTTTIFSWPRPPDRPPAAEEILRFALRCFGPRSVSGLAAGDSWREPREREGDGGHARRTHRLLPFASV